ncbi:MAG: carboxypeptidase-like regulatory domain-containing protein [Bacteroidota bacterium]
MNLVLGNIVGLMIVLTTISAFGQQNILDQKVTISFKNQTVVEALELLQKETEYTITYQPSDLPKEREITRSFKRTEVREIIKEVWGSDALSFLSTGENITIRPNKIKKGRLQGRLTDDNKKPLTGATIQLLDTQLGVITDENGEFSISEITNGIYTASISSVGFEKYQREIQIDGNTINLSVSLKPSIDQLDEIVVYGKSVEQEKREQPIKVEAINTRVLRAQSISLPQVINQTSGVRVRQAGGVGSATIININGLQGRAIRFFRDNIPLDYMGSAFDLSLLPVDQLSNVEIYKGVLPVSLGADALGGAVNFLTRDDNQDYLDISYGMGSFGTHQINFNSYYQIPDSKFHVGIASYFLRSDNNFSNKAPVTDPVTQTSTLREVERFHDAVTSGYAELTVGLKNIGIADLIEISGGFFDGENELQNGLLLRNPYGQALNTERNYTGTVRLKKAIRTFDLDVFAAYGNQETSLTDTTNRQYDWFGDFIIVNRPGGELSGGAKTLQTLNFETVQGRLLISKDVNSNHRLSLSHNLIFEERVGENPFGQQLADGSDPLASSAKYLRLVTGLGWNARWFRGRLEQQLTLKHYGLSTEGIGQAIPENPDDALVRFLESSKSSFGGGNSFKYSFSKNIFLRSSYEYAIRIPESSEYFGDGLFIQPNLILEPETSHNINAGFFYQFSNPDYSIDVNSYYRLVGDNIFLQENGFGIGQYLNLEDLRIQGVETTIKGSILTNLRFSTSITWQDLRRRKVGNGSALEDSRLPNIPFFFASANLRYKKDDLVGIKGSWEFYASYSFVEQFHLTGIPKSQEPSLFGQPSNISDLLIPSQHVVDIGGTYKVLDTDFWINLEVNNLLDNEVFDNFRVPRPGINYRVKLRYQLTGKSLKQ